MYLLTTCILFSYLCGSISCSTLICSLTGLPDPRTHGSNNPGAANCLRIGGIKIAAIVLVGDILKGLLPVLIAKMLNFDSAELGIIGIAAFLGHLYPLFLQFRGGKGVATFLGVLFALNYPIGIFFVIIWLLLIKFTKISSVASLSASMFCVIYVISTANINLLPIIIMAIFILWKHRTNLARLIADKEHKVTIWQSKIIRSGYGNN